MTFDNAFDTGPLRTRGPVKRAEVRHGFGAYAPGASVRAGGGSDTPDDARSLGELVRRLRQDVGGLPIVAAVHDPASDGSAAFIRAVTFELRSADALWLVPPEGTATSDPQFTGIDGVTLDLARGTDEQAYRNLVADLVFFGGSHDSELMLLPKWHDRLRALVVHRGMSFSSLLTAKAVELTFRVYEWSGDGLQRVGQP
jgi:hypothetical protein